MLAGGVALNCVGNGRILREGPFENIWIQPAAGDAGGALGAALFIWHQLLDKPRQPQTARPAARLAPRARRSSDDEIAEFLDRAGAVYTTCASDEQLCDEVSSLDRAGKGRRLVPGAHGVRPAGPGRPQHPRRRAQREDAVGDEPEDQVPRVVPAVRPVRACARRSTSTSRCGPARTAPTCCWSRRCARRLRTELGAGYDKAFGIDKLNFTRSTHAGDHARRLLGPRADGRPRSGNPLFHQLLTQFYEKTGCPVIINTSFNVRGEPIVCTPEDAYRCFLMTDMDVLVLGRQIILREDQPQVAEEDKARHLAQFQLD